MSDRILAGLNPEQRDAATSEAVNLRILAGAGSGKTRVLTRRIAHLSETGAIDPRAVLAVTFTRKAASELRRRLGQLGLRDGVQAGTFHSIAWAQLRQRWAERGIRPPELVTSKLPLVREVSRERSRTTLLDLMAEIEWANARCIEPGDYPAAAPAARRDPPYEPAKVAEVMAAYAELKMRRRVVDFDDLLRLAVRDLAADPVYARGRRWAGRFLFVDEFQDVNPRQWRLLDAWRSDDSRLTVVGDPNQAIYAWNGADASYLVDFERLVPDSATVSLTTNYRSTPQILTVANGVLRDGTEQRGAGLRAHRPDGEIPAIVVHPDDGDEAKRLAQALRRAHRSGRRWSDLAVLTRTNAQLAPIARALHDADIPHRTRGGGGFLRQPEVEEALRALRRGGEVGSWLSDLRRRTAEMRALDGGPDDQGQGEGVPVTAEPSSTAPGTAATDETGDGDGEADGGGGGAGTAGRLANLDELISLGAEYLDLDPGGTANGFLAWLRTGLAEEGDGAAAAVELATFHAAKGLEWSVVHIAGMEQGYVPIHYAETQAELAEETRLMYVALTRAEDELFLHRAERRTTGAREMRRRPSPMLTAVEDALDLLAGHAPGHTRRRRAPRSPRAPRTSGSVSLEPADAAVFEKLRAWRLQRARASGKPAFVILTDDVLRSLATERPSSRSELLDISGIGPTKADRFGDAVLEIIATDRDSHG